MSMRTSGLAAQLRPERRRAVNRPRRQIQVVDGPTFEVEHSARFPSPRPYGAGLPGRTLIEHSINDPAKGWSDFFGWLGQSMNCKLQRHKFGLHLLQGPALTPTLRHAAISSLFGFGYTQRRRRVLPRMALKPTSQAQAAPAAPLISRPRVSVGSEVSEDNQFGALSSHGLSRERIGHRHRRRCHKIKRSGPWIKVGLPDQHFAPQKTTFVSCQSSPLPPLQQDNICVLGVHPQVT